MFSYLHQSILANFFLPIIQSNKTDTDSVKNHKIRFPYKTCLLILRGRDFIDILKLSVIIQILRTISVFDK